MDLSDLKDSFVLFLLSRRMYLILHSVERDIERERDETMLLDQAIENATSFATNAIGYTVIGISCIVGIAVFIGVAQVLSGPCVKRHIGH